MVSLRGGYTEMTDLIGITLYLAAGILTAYISPVLTESQELAYNTTLLKLVEHQLSPENYDKKIRPHADLGTATYVTVNIFINSISSVNEADMDFSINMYLRQEWDDPRLAHPGLNKSVTLNYDQYEDLWVPDLFFPYEKASILHDITVPNRLLMLSQGGHILYSQRVSLRLSCNMFLEKYPMDNQTCYMQIESYGYAATEMVVRWRDADAFNSNKDLQLPEFKMTGLGPLNCSQTYPLTGEFSCIRAVITMSRHFNYYLIQTYIPSMLIVILSWVSFWIDKDAVPARITLGLLTVLTMTTQASGINQRLPRVSYIKAIDVWMSTCLIFVFGALVEYSIVNVLARKDKSLHLKVSRTEVKRRSASKMDIFTVSVESNKLDKSALRHRNSETGISITEDVNDRVNETSHNRGSHPPRNKCTSSRRTSGWRAYCLKCCKLHFFEESRADFADLISRALFPAAFIIFNVFYWCLYLYVV